MQLSLSLCLFLCNIGNRLGNEKHKTKSATWNSTCTVVTWLEQFDFHLFEDQSHLLEIHLCDKGIKGKEELVGR